MSIKKLVALFVLFFVVLTIFTVPVNLIVKQLPLPKNVAYQELEGTLWQGTIKAVQFDKTVLTQVKWQFLPLKLLTGKLAVQLRWGNARASQEVSGSGIASLGFSGYQVTDATVRLPANAVKSMIPFPMGEIFGRVIADVKAFTFAEPLCEQLDGDLIWTQAGVDVNGKIDFGVISSVLTCEENQVVSTFDGENLLGLQGRAVVKSQKSFGFDGFLKPSTELPAIVHQGIGMLGKADSKGRYKISL